MLDEELSTDEERWMGSLSELLQSIARRTNDEQRTEMMEEIRKIALRFPLPAQTAVESGSRR